MRGGATLDAGARRARPDVDRILEKRRWLLDARSGARAASARGAVDEPRGAPREARAGLAVRRAGARR